MALSRGGKHLKKTLKQKICYALLGLMLSNGFSQMASPAFAAAVKAEKGVSSTEETNSYDAVSFTERIKKILADGEKSRNAILHGGENSEKADSVSQSTPELPPPIPLQPSERDVEQKPAQQQPVPSVQTGDVYNFDWQGTALAQTLYAISKISGKRVVINGQLSGTVYTSLYAVTYDKALDYLAKSFNFNWMLDDDGEAIIISTSDLMKQSKVFDVRFADKDKLKAEMVSRGIDEKNIYVNNQYSSISVTGTPYQLSQAAKLIAGTDKPVSQCLMIAQLIEVSHGDDLNLGMQYSLPTYTHTANAGTDSMSGKFVDKLTFSASAEANRALSKGKVVARPMIMTKNGQEAMIHFGDDVPVQQSTTTTSSTQVTFEFKPIGTDLKITPIINERDGEVDLAIDANMSNISKWVTSGNSSAPQISSRKATTNVHLKSGQSFVIGGLMSSKDLDNLSGIPGLMNLPILGNLFRYHSVSKENTEVFIMVTPYIVDEATDPKALLREVK